jgi:dipeptidyl aminopeptidase/acylaminoacyl peptidase
MNKVNLLDFLNYWFLSTPRFSPNGKYVGYIAHKCDVSENNYKSDIYISELLNGSRRQLTSTGNCEQIFWLRDGRLAFTQKNNTNKKTPIFTVNPESGDTRLLFSVPEKITRIETLDDERYVVQIIGRRPDNYKIEPIQEISNYTEEYSVYDELPFLDNDRGVINGQRQRLFIWESGKQTLTPITSETFEVVNWCVNSETGTVLYYGTDYTSVRRQIHQVFLYNVFDSTSSLLLDEMFVYRICFAGNHIIAAASDMKEYGLYQCPDFLELNPDEPPRHFCRSPYVLENGTTTDCTYINGEKFLGDDDAIYYVATVRNDSRILRTDFFGNTTVLTPENGAVHCFDIWNGHFAFIGMLDYQLEELYFLDKLGQIRIAEPFNMDFLAEKSIAIPKPVRFVNKRGIEIDGWVMEPVDHKKGKKSPGILNIHGGPKGVYSQIFFHEMQLWAASGYYVFYCNPTGSTGRGDEFTDLRGKYGTVDYEDLMEFTDHVVATYDDIDPARLGVAGGSYAGFMVNWIIGHTNRFRAAISMRSVSNWISNFGIADIGYFFNVDEHKATLWNGVDRLWWMSPIKYANNVTTPTLILHSDDDFRCPLSEAYQMFSCLKIHDVDCRLVVFHDENHHLSRKGRPRNRIARMNEIINWLDFYLK